MASTQRDWSPEQRASAIGELTKKVHHALDAGDTTRAAQLEKAIRKLRQINLQETPSPAGSKGTNSYSREQLLVTIADAAQQEVIARNAGDASLAVELNGMVAALRLQLASLTAPESPFAACSGLALTPCVQLAASQLAKAIIRLQLSALTLTRREKTRQPFPRL
jgi:hypothetical protein